MISAKYPVENWKHFKKKKKPKKKKIKALFFTYP